MKGKQDRAPRNALKKPVVRVRPGSRASSVLNRAHRVLRFWKRITRGDRASSFRPCPFTCTLPSVPVCWVLRTRAPRCCAAGKSERGFPGGPPCPAPALSRPLRPCLAERCEAAASQLERGAASAQPSKRDKRREERGQAGRF